MVLDEVTALAESIHQNCGALHILVNNAGGQYPATAENITPKGFTAVIQNNLIGAWNVIYTLAHRFFFLIGRESS
jgi:citronellol/citronellal dehydrogenase